MKKTLTKILQVLVDILIVIILIISAIIVIMSVSSKSTGVPNLFGYAPLSVQSDSMVPTFTKGDLIVCKLKEDNTQYKVGDVVTFHVTIQNVETLDSHRIYKINEENGETQYITKGDNNPVPDDGYITKNDIVATYTEQKVAGLGGVLDFLRSQLGFFLCILLPMILFFIFQAVRVVRNLIAYNKAKAFEEGKSAATTSNELSEEEKKKVAEEYLAKMKSDTEKKE